MPSHVPAARCCWHAKRKERLPAEAGTQQQDEGPSGLSVDASTELPGTSLNTRRAESRIGEWNPLKRWVSQRTQGGYRS